MEPHPYQSFFIIPFFSLLLLNSLHVCLSSESGFSPKPSSAPEMQPWPRVSEVAFPPSSDPPTGSEFELESQSLSSSESVSDSTLSSSLISISGLDSIIESAVKTANPLIEKICGATDYPDLCITTVAPLAKDKIDIFNILGKTIEASSEFLNVGIALAKKLASTPGTPPDVAAILKECRDSYSSALYNFQEVSSALPAKDIGRMNSMLSSVITDVGDCEDAFSGQISPLAIHADKVTKMTSNCLAIVAVIPEYN